jgi:hypothetical protein
MAKDQSHKFYGKDGKASQKADAKGQFAEFQADRKNDGVTNADLRVLSGNKKGDATFPLKQD